MALTVTGPVNITYAGGAAGPATTTQSALAAGFVIPTMPSGGSATFSAPVNITGTVAQSNTATITPPAGTSDPVPGNNSATATTSPAGPTCCLAFSGATVTPNPVPAGTSFTIAATISETCGLSSASGVAEITGLPAGITGATTKPYPALLASGSYQMTWTFTNTSNTALSVSANVHSNAPAGVCPADLPFSFTTAAAPPARSVNITTFKTDTTATSPTAGTPSTFRNRFFNNGPDAAGGVSIRDIPGAGYGSKWAVNTSLNINITYSGGAAGPATATLAQFTSPSGIVIPTWPSGGQVQVDYTIVMMSSGNANRNTATLGFPPDVTDTFPADNFQDLDFNVGGAAQACVCNASVTVSPLDIFFGSQFTGSVTTPGGSCCVASPQLRTRYWFPAANTGSIAASSAAIDVSVPCNATTPYTDPSPARGWYRYSVIVTDTLGGTCEVAEGGFVINSALLPNQYQQAIDSGTWPAHHVS